MAIRKLFGKVLTTELKSNLVNIFVQLLRMLV